MKSKLFSLLYLFILGSLFSSCEESNSVDYESDDILKKNNITDVVEIFQQKRLVADNTMYLYTGVRNQHDWFALFDTESGLLIREWYGQKRNYIKPKDPIYSFIYPFFFDKENENEFYFIYEYFSDTYDKEVQLVAIKNNSVEYGTKFQTEADTINAIEADTVKYLSKQNRFWIEKSGHSSIIDFDGNIVVHSLSPGYEYDNKKWYLGFKNDLGYLAIQDNDTLHEYIFNEGIEWNRVKYLGYGKYENYKIESFYSIGMLARTNIGYIIIPTYNTDSKKSTIVEDVFILGNNTHKFIRLDNCDYFLNEENKVDKVLPWFNGSILLYKKYVISPNLEIIAEGSYSKYGNFTSDSYVPVSYSDWVVIDMSGTRGHMERYNNKEELLWSLSLDLLDKYRDDVHDPQYTLKLEHKNSNLYTFTCDILTYDGNRYKETFTVNVDTGELI